MQPIWKLSQCVLIGLLRYIDWFFLNTLEFKRTEKCIVIAFGLFACNCSHCLDYPIVIQVTTVKNFVFLVYTELPKLFLHSIT